MKKVLLTIIAAAALGSVCQGGEAEKPLAPFMANPSAEKAYGNQSALGFSAFTKTGSQYKWSEEASRTGKMGLQMIQKKDMGNSYGSLSLSGMNLKTDRLYCFSLYYRTRQEKPQQNILILMANKYLFRYPSASDWTRAALVFPGKEKASLRLYTHATENGIVVRGKTGNKDSKGRFPLLNRIDLIIDMDDFDLRELAEKDFKGNLVENGGFEKGSVFPPDWRHGHSGSISLDNKVNHGGKKSLRLDIPMPRKKNNLKKGLISSNFMPMKSGKIYVISLWMKVKESKSYVIFSLIGGSNRQRPLRWWRKNITTPAEEWKKYEFFVEPSTEDGHNYQGEQFVCRLEAALYSKIANSLWIDDVQIEIMNFE